ncbi:SDR family oxidoreductase [Lutibacter sp. B1]|uniref:SDR family oxidoreductase n=1 Tax=Lutibacter sp. B1 TaxID=2725996 RepID=UPI001456CA56|nr:SDR family oxidoreductase [Lutibacter sp. B1]NLP59251.1 SDR family oxidoreductase [Lutibacter sp. B1]
MKIGITGASGKLGQLVVSKLKEHISAEDIIALVRTPEKVESLGINARTFDYNQPNKLAAALKGIDKLLLISGNEIGKRFLQHSAVINAAKEVGIKHFVYTSLLKADSSTLVLAPEHLNTEKAIKASGLDFTILRNGWYNENYTERVKDTVAHGKLYGSSSDAKISSASREDFAEAAVVVLCEDKHRNKTYELSGDLAFTMEDYASEISKLTGKKIPYVNLPEKEFASVLEQAGLPEPVAAFFAGTHTATLHGDLYDDGNQLNQLIGRPTTTISKSISKAL